MPSVQDGVWDDTGFTGNLGLFACPTNYPFCKASRTVDYEFPPAAVSLLGDVPLESGRRGCRWFRRAKDGASRAS